MSEPTAIQQWCEADYTPFPYEDCRTLLALSPGEYDGLIPDLDLYFSTIAGYASSASRVHSWSADGLRQLRQDLASSFFEDHPEYELLQRDISDDVTPNLSARLRLYDELRIELLQLARDHERI